MTKGEKYKLIVCDEAVQLWKKDHCNIKYYQSFNNRVVCIKDPVHPGLNVVVDNMDRQLALTRAEMDLVLKPNLMCATNKIL